ncbi:AAA family ATPase [Alkalihalobacillus sp. LMS6]|uniref:AAA family ATPase n=1 Tax=Alkalihalobacillus sp. LMS6 TaxID=2924034 RepID=UPI0020D14204|nr:AAA family ATPase [Alkalihalobacillus sp. LMS6]UTR06786.1 AAA family ATPase [Alkalihalobacillus sp. LMS6]
MAKLVILFGPQAVGKMTVGEALAEQTSLKLFHNHMSIDMVAPIFGFQDETWRLVDLFRKEMFQSVAKSDLDGLIFTYVWAFDRQEDWEYIDNVASIFEENGGSVYFVELEAAFDERLARNKSTHRLQQKPTKRDVDFSEKELKESAQTYRLNSKKGELTKPYYLRINNTNRTSSDVAAEIKRTFNL